jgi:curli biogenesis system outer membrane secretion channel CsgG
MKHAVHSGLVGLFIFVLCAVTPAQEGQNKPAVAIKTFENPPYYYSSNIGTGLTDLFITELMKAGKYRIVERDGLDDLIDEIELGQSVYVNESSAVPQGHFISPEYLVIVKVTNFGEKEKNYSGAGLSSLFGVRQRQAYVRMDFRIVDATTREVIYSGYGDGEDTTKGLSFMGVISSQSGAVDVSSRSFLSSQLGRATIKSLRKMIDKIDHTVIERQTSGAVVVSEREKAVRAEAERVRASTPGKILAIVSDQVMVINLGQNHGLKAGDTLDVFKEESIRSSRGEVVYTDYHLIGTVKITEVQADRAKAARLDGSGFSEGNVVRRQ